MTGHDLGPSRRTETGVEREDVAAALEVHRELGPAYEPEVVDALADRIEREIERRVDARLAQETARRNDDRERSGRQTSLAITSIALGIPISGISGGIADLPGLAVAWLGIAAVNVAHAWRNRR